MTRPATPRLILAPMAGYTDAAMRRLCHTFGAALTYTEMVSAPGLVHDSQKTLHLLETFPDEGPVIAHLFGADPATLGEATARVTELNRFVGIDLNAGCPVRKVACQGAGAALIKSPATIHAILSAMCHATHLPISIKTRIGPNPDSVLIFEILDAAQRAGASAIALHGRFTSQGHAGDVHRDIIAAVKARASIPVYGNGGIASPASAWRMMKETHVDGLMIARGAIGNPWIFRDIATALASEEPPTESSNHHRPDRGNAALREIIHAHLDAERELMETIFAKFQQPSEHTCDASVVSLFRNHLVRYIHGLPGAAAVRGKLGACHATADMLAAVDALLS